MAKKSVGVRRDRRVVPLDTKVTPSRAAGVSTFEFLLATAGQLLTEVGFEGLTTNLICKRAGMTPPALYRYFPNKFAVLQELGRRLMLAQDDAVFVWMEQGGLESEDIERAVENNRRLHKAINSITRKSPGGVWIMRALRAVPLLHEVRIQSRDEVAQRLAKALRPKYSTVSRKRLLAATRLSTELMYAATEMAMESPSQEAQISEEVSWMVCLYYAQLANRSA
jgi:AcrR family transcriptional regulator